VRPKKFTPTPRLRNWKCLETYHVYQRGNYRQQIFFTEAQILTYLQRIDLLAKRYSVRIHGFCLMSNHVHFLLETTRKDGISRFMQQLQAYHARWIHGTQLRDGHLWKNRFGAKLITSPHQFRETLLYIERNPLAARLSGRAEDYPYSSAAAHVANSPSATIGEGKLQATIHLFLDRWHRECDYQNWRHLLQPRGTAPNGDIDETLKILGKQREAPLDPIPIAIVPAAKSATQAS